MATARLSATRPRGKNPGAAKGAKTHHIAIALEDILHYPKRDANGIRLLGDYGMKPGGRMYEWYQTPSKVDMSQEAEGEEDSISFTPKYVTQHPGDEVVSREAIQDWLGVPVIILAGRCGEEGYDVFGDECAPLQLQPALTKNNDGTFYTMTWQSFSKTGYLHAYYTGNIVLAGPTKAATNEIAVDGAVNKIYEAPAEDTTSTPIEFTVANLASQDLVTLIGSGGEAPHTLENGVAGDVTVVLKQGTVWTAVDGASISLRYVDGGTTKYLIEESRN